MPFLMVAVLLFSVSTTGWLAAQNHTTTNLDALVGEALKNNPKLHAERHVAEAAMTRVNQSAAWEPPQIGIELFQMPVRSIPVKDNRETDYFIQQNIPWPGKTSLMQNVERLNVEMKTAEIKALELQISQSVKKSYFELVLARRKTQINARLLTTLTELQATVTRQFEVGMAGQVDVLRIKSELIRLRNDSLGYLKDAAMYESELASLLGSTTPGIETVVSGAPAELAADLHLLTQTAQDRRPELKSLSAYSAMFAAARSATQRDYYPDFMLRGMYKDMSGTPKDFWSVMISISIPLAPWSKDRFKGRVSEYNRHILHAEMEKENMNTAIASEVYRHYAAFNSNAEIVKNYERYLIPQANQSFSVVVADYQTGRVPLNMVLESHRELLMTEMMHADAVAEAQKSMADLEQTVGLSADEMRRLANGSGGEEND